MDYTWVLDGGGWLDLDNGSPSPIICIKQYPSEPANQWRVLFPSLISGVRKETIDLIADGIEEAKALAIAHYRMGL